MSIRIKSGITLPIVSLLAITAAEVFAPGVGGRLAGAFIGYGLFGNFVEVGTGSQRTLLKTVVGSMIGLLIGGGWSSLMADTGATQLLQGILPALKL